MINRTEQLSGWVSTQGRAALYWTLLWFSSLFNLLTHLTLSETSWVWEASVSTQKTLCPTFRSPYMNGRQFLNEVSLLKVKKLISQWPDTWSAQNAYHSASKALLIRQKSEGGPGRSKSPIFLSWNLPHFGSGILINFLYFSTFCGLPRACFCLGTSWEQQRNCVEGFP